jgi:hypothetical protein
MVTESELMDSEYCVPFGKDAQMWVLKIPGKVPRNGKAFPVEVKKVTTKDDFLSSDTASKYHQSKTDPLIGWTLGPSSE